MDVNITKEKPLIYHSSKSNSFSFDKIGDEYALNVVGSSELIKELELLMTTGTYTIEKDGETIFINLKEMINFMFSTIDDASRWNDTDCPITLYFEGDINQETLDAIRTIVEKYSRGDFPEGEGVDEVCPSIKKYENPTDEQIKELTQKAKEIDEEFADIIENEEKTLIGLTGIQYESALKIIEENEA